MQHLFNRRIPLLKFFLKQQLMWVPIMGLAWWALDFPFMRRFDIAKPEYTLEIIRRVAGADFLAGAHT